MPVVELKDVAKTYKKIPLFSAVSLRIDPGTATAVRGPNGSGKSVLLRVMCRFVTPDSGTVTIDPEYLDGAKVFPASFGVLIDRPGYLPGHTGLENLLSLARIRNKVDESQVRAAMERLGLEPDNAAKVRNYSLGMKQKLSLAQAIMENQRVLVLDEPFNALDDSSVATVRGILRDHVDAGGTLIFTSHNQSDIDALAERQFAIDGGRLRPLS